MLPKNKLILTKDYWMEIFSNEIWRQCGEIPDTSEECDAVAINIVDDNFMQQIAAIILPHSPEENKVTPNRVV